MDTQLSVRIGKQPEEISVNYFVVEAYGREMIVIGNALSMQILALS